MKSAGVAIAGAGCLCACGKTVQSCFDGALTGIAQFALPTGRVKSTYAQAYPVFLVADEIVRTCPPQQTLSLHFFLTAAREALAQSNLPLTYLQRKRVGVIVGCSVDASFHCLSSYKHFRNHILSEQDYAELIRYLASPLAQTVSRHFGFTGPFQTVVTACASGTDAVGLAKGWIENGVCDAVLCGGTDEINLIPYDGFIRLLIAGKERCRPFDKNRNGINIGEGAGALLLISDEMMEENRSHPIGYVLGYGNACDGYHPTAPDPNGAGLQRAITQALADAHSTADALAFVNAHATASQANDAAEAAAFRACLPGVAVWGSKGVTGHTLGAAGAVEAVLTLTALNNRLLPATHGFNVPDDTLGLSPSAQTRISKRTALSTSLAFGGCNAALVLGAYDL